MRQIAGEVSLLVNVGGVNLCILQELVMVRTQCTFFSLSRSLSSLHSLRCLTTNVQSPETEQPKVQNPRCSQLSRLCPVACNRPGKSGLLPEALRLPNARMS